MVDAPAPGRSVKGAGAVVAGVDFGTQSVRVALVAQDGMALGTGMGEYPVHRGSDDSDRATQAHDDHMHALTKAMHNALRQADQLSAAGGVRRVRNRVAAGAARDQRDPGCRTGRKESAAVERFVHPVESSTPTGAIVSDLNR